MDHIALRKAQRSYNKYRKLLGNKQFNFLTSTRTRALKRWATIILNHYKDVDIHFDIDREYDEVNFEIGIYHYKLPNKLISSKVRIQLSEKENYIFYSTSDKEMHKRDAWLVINEASKNKKSINKMLKTIDTWLENGGYQDVIKKET